MPLVAIVNGTRTIAPFLTPDRWDSIRPGRESIILPCCQSNGFKRTSKNGLRHFVHKTPHDACNCCSETQQHLQLKHLVADACNQAGWQVDVERFGTDWRADVFATRGSAQIAFEVQLSPSTLEDLLARQARYWRDGIRGCWFYGEKLLPRHFSWDEPRFPAEKRFPAFRLSLRGHGPAVELGSRCIPIAEAVNLLLSRKVRFCAQHRIERREEIHFFYTQCWNCKKETGVYRAGWGMTGCAEVSDAGIFGGSVTIGDLDYASRPSILRRVEKFLQAKDRNLKITLPKWEYSPTSQRHYNSFRCYWCGALFGPEFVLRVYEGEEVPSRLIGTDVVTCQFGREPCPHWCVSETHDFCC